MLNEKVRIAILDSGIDKELKNDVYYCKTYVEEDVIDRFCHGTMCYNLIHSYVPNGIFKILNSIGKTTSFILIKALEDLIDEDVNVINLSISLLNIGRSEQIEKLNKVCECLYKQGKIIVCSLQNGRREFSLPAGFKSVIGVGGASFNSNFTYWFNKNSKIQVIANSTPILLPSINHKYDLFKGNSKATALISCIIANMIARKGIYRNVDDLQQILHINAVRNFWCLEDVQTLNFEYLKPRLIDKKDINNSLLTKIKTIVIEYLANRNSNINNFFKDYYIINGNTFNDTKLIIDILPILEQKLGVYFNYAELQFSDLININILCKKIEQIVIDLEDDK